MLWNFRTIHAVSPSSSSKKAKHAGSYNYLMTDVESTAEYDEETPFNKDVTGMKVAVRHFSPQVYRDKEVWLTIFQVNKVQNPPRGSQKSMRVTCWSLYELADTITMSE